MAAISPPCSCRLHKEFHNFKFLGSGSYGMVLRCERKQEKGRLAIKIIRKNDEQDDIEMREVEALRCLKGGPNVIQYYEHWVETRDRTCRVKDYELAGDDMDLVMTPLEVNGTNEERIIQEIFIIMEHCGKSLHDLMEKGSSIDNAIAWKYFKQLMVALEFIHKHRYVHRDISIRNIFTCKRDGEWQIVLADFGCAKLINGRDYNATVPCTPFKGTLPYAAPEIRPNEPQRVGFSADIFSSGVVLVEILYGKFKIDEESSESEGVEIIRNISEKGEFPIQWSVSEKDARFLKRLLAENPKYRPSATDILSEMD